MRNQRRPSSSTNPLDRRVEAGRCDVAAGQGGAGQPDDPVVQRDLDPGERDAVVDAAAGGLGGAVGRDQPQAQGTAPLEQRRRCRRATHQDRLEVGQRGQLRRQAVAGGGQRAVQLGGDQGRVPRLALPGPQRHRRDVTRVGEHGLDARERRAHQHLEARDVLRRQGEHPAPGSAEPLVGGPRGRDEGVRVQQHAAGGAGGPRGGDHGRHPRRDGGWQARRWHLRVVRRERGSGAVERRGHGPDQVHGRATPHGPRSQSMHRPTLGAP